MPVTTPITAIHIPMQAVHSKNYTITMRARLRNKVEQRNHLLARVSARSDHRGLQQHALEQHLLVCQVLECLCPDLLSHLSSSAPPNIAEMLCTSEGADSGIQQTREAAHMKGVAGISNNKDTCHTMHVCTTEKCNRIVMQPSVTAVVDLFMYNIAIAVRCNIPNLNVLLVQS